MAGSELWSVGRALCWPWSPRTAQARCSLLTKEISLSMAAVPGGYDLSGSREAAWEARWKCGKGGAVEVRSGGRGEGTGSAPQRRGTPSRCEDEVGADGSGRARGRRRGRAGPWPTSPGGAGALGGVARLTRSAAIATATGRPWRRDRVSAPAMCETEGNNPDGSKAHRVFDFARGWARWRAGGGSSTTDRSDGRNSSGGRQWQDRFWRIRPGSSSTRAWEAGRGGEGGVHVKNREGAAGDGRNRLAKGARFGPSRRRLRRKQRVLIRLTCCPEGTRIFRLPESSESTTTA
ncbi:hypothetical protein PVAP13_5KG253200 [Panicum virgatum]|uniref:Uncharacterized protein n=1 Tax=Panicum virgatum TaxID=38727 RepID=A0A8T0SFL9_PANVG|nr:hypothetical protein PVAP13_5KG253200 [Panicum virgatum]